MVFKMASGMVFVPNFCTVKMYGKNSFKQHSTQIWNKMVQYNLNLNLLDQIGPKAKNLIIE